MDHNNSVSKILSYVFHPIFIPIYITLLYVNIFKTLIPDEARNYMTYVISMGTIVLPLITVVLLKKTNLIESIFLNKQSERTIPIISTGLYIYITARLLMSANLNGPLNNYLIGIVVTLSWILIFLHRTKISLHTAAISSALGFLIYLSHKLRIDLQVIIILNIIIIGAVSTARLKLKAHTCKEVALGIIFGIVPQLGYIFLY